MFKTDSEIVQNIINGGWDEDHVDYEKLRHLILLELEEKSNQVKSLQDMIDSITGLWLELNRWSSNLFDVIRKMELSRQWLLRESTVDHPGPYRLRLITSGNAEEILESLYRVMKELENAAPNLDGLNAGSSLCDWDIENTTAMM